MSDYFTSSAAGYVDIPSVILEQRDVSFYHAHTNATPLSAKDFRLLVRGNVKKICVIASNGDVFAASVEDGIRPEAAEYDERVSIIKGQVDIDLLDDPRFDEWETSERVYTAIREQAVRIALAYKWRLEGGRL